MSDADIVFDSKGFFLAIEATVQSRRLKWKDVSSQTQVGASTLSRMAQGRGPDSASLAKLAHWSGLNPADYVRHPSKPSEPEALARLTSHLRRDPRLSPEAAEALDQVIKTTYERLASNKG